MSDDGQFTSLIGVILAAGAGLGAMVRWIVGFWSKAADKRSEQQNETAKASTQALVANTASNAVLVVKIDQLGVTVADLGRKLEGIGDWMEQHTPVGVEPPRPPPRTRTPPHGTEYFERPSSKRGGGGG